MKPTCQEQVDGDSCGRVAEYAAYNLPQCPKHYRRSLNTQPKCRVKGCRARTDLVGRQTRVGYCRKHEGQLLSTATLIRGMERVAKNVEPEPETGCWLWQGKVNERSGQKPYGTFRCGTDRKSFGGNGKPLEWRTHRFTHLWTWGPHEHKHVIDHLCVNSLCCNPMHLAAMTAGDNAKMKGRRSKHPEEPWHLHANLRTPPIHLIGLALMSGLPIRPVDEHLIHST